MMDRLIDRPSLDHWVGVQVVEAVRVSNENETMSSGSNLENGQIGHCLAETSTDSRAVVRRAQGRLASHSFALQFVPSGRAAAVLHPGFLALARSKPQTQNRNPKPKPQHPVGHLPLSNLGRSLSRQASTVDNSHTSDTTHKKFPHTPSDPSGEHVKRETEMEWKTRPRIEARMEPNNPTPVRSPGL